jgi:putative methyltransferase (TIGR04325 family)
MPKFTYVEQVDNATSWDDVVSSCANYDDPNIIDMVVDSTREVYAGNALHEHDGAAFDEILYYWELLSALLYATLKLGRLSVVDIGGALGTTYRQNLKFLDEYIDKWIVVEQEKLVAAGKEEFSTEILSFEYDVKDLANSEINVALLSGSLGYVPDPYSLLADIEALETCTYLVLDRTSLLLEPDAETFVGRQVVNYPDYQTSYPAWLFAEREFLTRLEEKWELVERWDCQNELVLFEGSQPGGGLWVRKDRG